MRSDKECDLNSEDAGLAEVISSSQVFVRPGRYAYLKVPSVPDLGDHFLVSRDQDEITVVTEESNLAKISFEEYTKWFTLIEIQVSQPFVTKGFIASISGAIAERDLNILVVSTFSKDYLLVREESKQSAVAALRDLGFSVCLEES